MSVGQVAIAETLKILRGQAGHQAVDFEGRVSGNNLTIAGGIGLVPAAPLVNDP